MSGDHDDSSTDEMDVHQSDVGTDDEGSITGGFLREEEISRSESMDASTSFRSPSPIADITNPTEFEKQQALDPLLAPLSEEQKQFYTEDESRRSINLLIIFSLLMFTMPLSVMYVTYEFLFKQHFGLPQAQAMLYAGFCGITCTIVIVIWFVRIAYKDEQRAEQQLLKSRAARKND
ncbi:unnamed protein product, partial [Mesorhabditis spiculigera]